MRFLTRISSWLKAGARAPAGSGSILEARPQEALDRGIDPALLARLPKAPVELFRKRLLEAVGAAHETERAVLATLDPAVEVLVIPRTDGLSTERDRKLSAEIDEALRVIEGGGRSYSSLTWSALRDARPPFSPPASEWAGDIAHRFEGDAGIIFFVDVEAVAIAMCHAAESQGLTARVDDDAQIVRVSDGRFEAHVGTSAVLAEGLWTGRGPFSIIARRASGLYTELRSFFALLKGLERRFVGMRFDVRSEGFVVRSPAVADRARPLPPVADRARPLPPVADRARPLPPVADRARPLPPVADRARPLPPVADRARPLPPVADPPPATLDYRHLAAAQRQSGLSVDAWLQRAHLEDLVLDGADLGVLVRSPKYLKAYPEALAVPSGDEEGDSVLVAVRLSESAATVVTRQPGDHAERFEHYRDEATRQLPFFSFDGHAFVVEQGTRQGVARAVCIVGDKASSVAFHPSLVKGVLEQLIPDEDEVRVRSFSENTACFASAHSSDELLEESRKRAHQLEGDLFDDGSDALHIDRTVSLPDVGHGHFELSLVPEAYFAVRDQALTRSDLGRGHTDYLRGLSFELLGRPDLAVPAFERAVRQSSSDGEMNLALGRTLSSLEEHTRAVAFLEKAAKALPEHAEAVNALGVALYRSGRPARARNAFQRAVKLAPDEVGFLVNLGRTCCDERLYGEARAALEHALRLEPTSAEAHASMAVLCHRTGDKSRAMHHAREALAEQPDDDTVRELLRMLDEG